MNVRYTVAASGWDRIVVHSERWLEEISQLRWREHEARAISGRRRRYKCDSTLVYAWGSELTSLVLLKVSQMAISTFRLHRFETGLRHAFERQQG